MKKIITIIALICSLSSLVSCTAYQLKKADVTHNSPIYSYRIASIKGNNLTLRDYWLRDKADFKMLGMESHHQACEGLLELGDFPEAKLCFQLMYQQEEYDWPSKHLDDQYLNHFIDAVFSRYYYLIGDYEQAIRLADSAIQSLDKDVDIPGPFDLNDYWFWYGRMTAGYSGGLSQMALGASKIDDRYYHAVNNNLYPYKRDFQLKLFASRKAEMFFADKNYQAALDLLRGEESESSDADKATMVMVSVLSLGLGPLINNAVMGDADITGANTFAGNRLIHTYMVAKAHKELGNYKEAKLLYDELLKKLTGTGYETLFWQSSLDRAVIAAAENEPDKADVLFEQAIDTIEIQRSGLTSDSTKVSFVGDKQAAYREYVQFLLKEQRFTEAFENSDRAKGRALVDMLANRDITPMKASSDTHDLYGELREIDKAPERLLNDKEKQQNRTRALKRIYKKIKATNPELSSLITAAKTDSSVLQSSISDNEVMVQFYKLTDTYHAFIVTPTSVDSVALDRANIDDIDRQVAQFRKVIQNATGSDYMADAKDLYQKLMAPMQTRLAGKNIIVVPDGSLHYLPFLALHDGQSLLLQTHNIRVLSSASLISYLGHRDIRQGHVLALGNPDLGNSDLDLPGAETEVIALKKTMSHVDVLTRKAATESKVKSENIEYDILHIASHGKFDARDPLASRLILAADDKNDGLLTVGELYSSKLPASLVVLSACETGLGDVKNGGDVIGLTRGFITAGASSVISTLWVVEDTTTQKLMSDFYLNLNQQSQQNISYALSDAQRRVFSQVNSHPYYWAGFQLTGSI